VIRTVGGERAAPPEDAILRGQSQASPRRGRFGAVVGIATLTECLPVAAVAGEPFAEGRWSWPLGDVRPVRPFAWARRQQLFELSTDLPRVSHSS